MHKAGYEIKQFNKTKFNIYVLFQIFPVCVRKLKLKLTWNRKSNFALCGKSKYNIDCQNKRNGGI